ncbi:MAG: GDP-mannose 4,6-dehydratase [Thaumarchaeota archaeon]|nr:GDP-mannose 4,6-dehydratase [Nitrososphaerota archaeon]
MREPNSKFWEGKRVLITGITGFVGSWLSEILTSRKFGARVYGLVRRQSNPNLTNIEHLLESDKIELIRGDLHDVGSIMNALRLSEADVVYHLAAQSFVPHSFASPVETYTTNLLGTINVLEALRAVNRDIKMLFAGSSEEYGLVIVDDVHYQKMLKRYGVILPAPKFDSKGKVVSEIPIKESNPLRTVGTSPYGSSKRLAEDVCRTYVSCYKMNVHVTRAFNHTGPRRGREFVTSEVTRQIVEGMKGLRKEIMLGNLDAIRDFSDVRDIVRGYLLCVEEGMSGEVYNLCSGKGMSVAQLIMLATKVAIKKGLKKKLPVKVDRARLRPTDLPILIGDYSKSKKVLGWEPKIPFEKTIEDMIEFHLARI